MSNLRSDDKLRNIKPTDVILGADDQGCMVNFPPDNFSGSIPISIDTEDGEGEELFTEPELNSFVFKKIKSSDNSAYVTTDEDGNIDISVDIPELNIETISTEGSGFPLFKGMNNKDAKIASIVSSNIEVSEDPDGTVRLTANSIPGNPGQSTFKSIVFKRSKLSPVTPEGGTYDYPIPLDWSDGIPVENGNPAWMSTRIFTSDGLLPQQDEWSEPVIVSDSSTLDYEFSAFTGTNPGTPSNPLNGATWHNQGQSNDIWMAFREVRNGAYGVWSVVRVKGEQGSSGAGYTVVSNNPMASLAVGSDGIASLQKDFIVRLDVFMNATQLTATDNDIVAANQYRIILPTSPLPGVVITKAGSNNLRFRVLAGTEFTKNSVLTEISIIAGLGQTILKSTFVIAPVWTAEDATSLILTSDSNVIKQTPTGYIPETVTLRALKSNYDEIVTWDSEPIGVLATTGDTVIMSSSDLFTGEGDSVKINIQTPNGLSDSTTIVRVRDGEKGAPGQPGTAGSGYSVVSSNPMQSIAVGSDSTTSSQQSYLVSFAVYKNSTALQGTTAATLTDSQFRVEIPASPKSGITVSRENPQTLKYTVANGVVFTDESVTSLIDITVGSANTVMKSSFVIVPIKDAEDAVSLSLNVDSNIVKFDAFNNLITPTVITAMAVQQNSDSQITWSSLPEGIVSGNGTLKSINTSALFQSGNTSVKIRIDAGGMFDETTIVRIQDGAPGQPGQPGAPGINGTTGPSPRLMEFAAGAQYENGQDFIDYAYYRSNDVNEGWYTVKVVNKVRTIVTYTGGVPDTSPTGAWVKSPFTKEMSFGNVIAEQANIAGFVFRNQKLESQATTINAPCHVSFPGREEANLSLNGLEAIIKFADKMELTTAGMVMKDNCGKPRMLFQWLEPDGIPILRFLNADGSIKWEAGQEGYKEVIIYTTPERWDGGIAWSRKKGNEITPTGSDVPNNWACRSVDGIIDLNNYLYSPGTPNVSGTFEKLYVYVAPTPASTATEAQLARNGKTFRSNHAGAGAANGWYLMGVEIEPGGLGEQLRGTFNQYTNGVITNTLDILGTGHIKPCGV